ncbi:MULTISPECIES: molybdopterin molybdotransferase MoeA [unclassified Luteococcus]|uniref:molybdopterin molybdotransferase MoeA n=1 Tax=unclassified Luteococcus TaxID=2639923 RepID=UPI00313D8432
MSAYSPAADEPVSLDAHRIRVGGLVTPLPVVSEPLLGCHGLLLAGHVRAVIPVPAFDCSAMDGFCLRRSDLATTPMVLPVDGELPAGAAPFSPAPGHAVRIMTGARIPDGCDVVVPVELTDAAPGAGPVPASVTILRSEERCHIRPAGEDVAVDDLLLTAGTVLGATELAAAAATGLTTLPVRRRPRVLVITTGDELSDPGHTLGPAQIPDSNSVLVAATLRELGAEPLTVRHAGDHHQAIDRILDELTELPDLVVTTGGVSVGSHDVLQEWAAHSPRARLRLGSVAMTPGKPQGWGHVLLAGREVAMIALPGNPVAVHVGLQLFVRAVLDALTGTPDSRRLLTCRAGENFGTRPGRTRLVDVMLRDGLALPAPGGHGSHRIGTLHRADGLAIVADDVAAGSPVQVLLTR